MMSSLNKDLICFILINVFSLNNILEYFRTINFCICRTICLYKISTKKLNKLYEIHISCKCSYD